MSIVNLDRDLRWMNHPQALSLTQAETALATPEVRSDGVLNQNHGYMQSDVITFAGTAGMWRTFGLHMQWNNLGAQPYHVSGYCTSGLCVFGYGWSSTTTTKDSPTGINFLATTKNFDDTICIREMTGYTDENLVFFCMIPSDFGEGVCNMSVQRLSGKVDQYTSLVR